jgi:hypothetical protein
VPIHALFTVCTIGLDVSLQTKLRMLFRMLEPSDNDVLPADKVRPGYRPAARSYSACPVVECAW